jgi:EmrB/QacA subfamily drug resistance transporter
MNGNEERIEAWVWRAAGVVVLGSIMSILDTTIVNVGLNTLSRELHSGLSSIQWVVTGYMLALAAVIPLTGWAARRFGPKRVFMTSVVLFTAGSALCGIATTATELIAFRVLQGFGGGMIMPVGQMILARSAGPHRMGRVMSVTAVPTMLAPILGPTIGGLILHSASWRWIFYVNVPVGALALALGSRLLPAGGAEEQGSRLDLPGFLLMVTGLPLLTYGIAEIGATGSFSSPKVIVPIIAGTALVGTFVLHALRISHPLLDVRLYRRPTFATASLTTFALGAALFGSMVLLPIYLQQVRGQSVIDTGLLLAPQGIGMAIVMPVVGRLSDRMGGGLLALGGVILTTIATIPFGLIGVHTSLLWLSWVMVVRGMGIGIAFMPAFVAAFASLERSEITDATPQLNVLMRVGGSIGTAVLAVVLERGLAGAGHPPNLSVEAAAYGKAFWWSVAITGAAIVPSYLLWRAERAARRRAAVPATAAAVPEVGIPEAVGA